MLCFLFEFISLHLPAISSCHAMSTRFKSILIPDVFPLQRWASNWVTPPCFGVFLTNGTDQIPLASLAVGHFSSPWIIFVMFFFLHCLPSSKFLSKRRAHALCPAFWGVTNSYMEGKRQSPFLPTIWTYTFRDYICPFCYMVQQIAVCLCLFNAGAFCRAMTPSYIASFSVDRLHFLFLDTLFA